MDYADAYDAFGLVPTGYERVNRAMELGKWLALISLLPAFGCVHTGRRTMRANAPDTVTNIARFELAPDHVIVRSSLEKPGNLTDSAGREVPELRIQTGDYFEASGPNCTETWKLEEITGDAARFDVQQKCHGCGGPLPFILNLSGNPSRWTIDVQRPQPDETQPDAIPKPGVMKAE
jgi:hypothetical protein